MKKPFLLLASTIYLITACEKTIDIEYSQTNKQINNINHKKNEIDSLLGTWEGIMECPTCCDKKYTYRYTITKQNNNNLTGTVKITEIPNKQFYVVFKLDITYNKETKIMTLKTGGNDYIIDKNDSNMCGEYCINNTYILKLSKDHQHLNGEWTESSNCHVENVNSPINLEKI